MVTDILETVSVSVSRGW